jgi:peptidoglycan hydrolase-like protein with peptidoglycan-binding domain
LHEYLARYGYFPNAALAKEYPRWKPIVPRPPSNAMVYDEHTAEAVRALQANMGLTPTGVVDQKTEALTYKPRCGVPDRAPSDSSDKFSLLSYQSPSKWQNPRNIQYSIVPSGLPPGVSLQSATTAASNAAYAWSTGTNLFVASGRSDINISFTYNGCGGGDNVACATPHFDSNGYITSGTTIVVNTTYSFSASTPTPSGATDLQTVLAHELGHALGLDHSAFSGAIMYPGFPTGTETRVLSIDDHVARGALYGGLNQQPGAAVDVGASWGGLANGGSQAWVIGTDTCGAGRHIWAFTGDGWVQDTTGCGLTISEGPTGLPIVLGTDSSIWYKNSPSPTTGTWTQISPAGAFDVATGGRSGATMPGSIWAIAYPLGASGLDAAIYEFNGVLWLQDTGLYATAIALDGVGVPYVVDWNGGTVWRKPSANSSRGSWEQLPTPPSGAFDVGVSNFNNGSGLNYVFVTGNDGNIYILNEQTVNGVTVGPQWLQAPFSIPGGALARDIDVGADGAVWVVDSSNQIWQGYY